MEFPSAQNHIDLARMAKLNQTASSAQKLSGYQKPTTDDEKQMKQVANDFEAVFIKQLLDAMEKTVEREDGLFGNSSSEGYFRDMMYDETAKQIANAPGGSSFGLGAAIYKQLAKQAELNPSTAKISMGQTVKKGEE